FVRKKALGRRRCTSAASKRKQQTATGYWDNPNRNAKPHATTTITRHTLTRGRSRRLITTWRKLAVLHQSGGKTAHAGDRYSDQHRQSEPSASAAAEWHQRIGPRDADRYCGERNRERQHQRSRQQEQRQICKSAT